MKSLNSLFAALVISSFSFIANSQSMVDIATAGDKALSENNYTLAVENYLKVIELDTAKVDFTTVYNLGLAYEGLNDNTQAFESFKRAILMGYDERGAFAKLKSNADATKCTECLEKAYIEIAEKMPFHASYVHERLFYVYMSSKNNEKAIETAYKVLSEQPDNFAILKNLGFAYTSVNKADSATLYLEKALSIKTDDVNLNKTLGMIYYKTCEAKISAENKKYEKGKKDSSSYNTMMYNRQSYEKSYFPKAIKLLGDANKTLNNPEIEKLVSRMSSVIAAYSK